PFVSESPGTVLLKHLTEVPPSLQLTVPGISPELDALIQVLLAKEPAARYPSATILRDSLENIRLRPMMVAPPKTTGPVVTSNSTLPLVAPKPKSKRHAVDLSRPVHGAQRHVGRFVAVFCVLLLGAILAFAFGETLQRMFVQNAEPAKKTTVVKQTVYPKKQPAASPRQKKTRRSRRPGSSSASDSSSHGTKPSANTV